MAHMKTTIHPRSDFMGFASGDTVNMKSPALTLGVLYLRKHGTIV